MSEEETSGYSADVAQPPDRQKSGIPLDSDEDAARINLRAEFPEVSQLVGGVGQDERGEHP